MAVLPLSLHTTSPLFWALKLFTRALSAIGQSKTTKPKHGNIKKVLLGAPLSEEKVDEAL
jgi:hypothetical protein